MYGFHLFSSSEFLMDVGIWSKSDCKGCHLVYVIVKLHALLGRKCIMVSSHSYSPDTKNTHYTCLLVCVAFYRNADVTNFHITIIGLLLAISAIYWVIG